jgi:gamma-glutamyltranspeptidase / glutathione hydrolase
MRIRLRPLLAVAGIATALALPAGVAAQPRQHHPPAPPSGPFRHVPNATATGSGGAAASVDSVATGAAIDALRKGGNAVDAAVAAAGVLGVTEPFSCGIGGGGFMVIRTPNGRVTTIDGRETAPAMMKPDSFFEGDKALSMADARWSGLSVGVPGTVATWETALRKYGTWRLGRALQPGIDVARRGFAVDKTFIDQTLGATNIIPTGETVDYFDDIPSTAALYLDSDGTPHEENSIQRNPDLARTYEILARFGAGAFYHGPIARAIAQAAQHPPIGDANHTWRPGLLTEDDLAKYRAIERAPTHINYRGLDVWGMGPPSSGGSTVGEALNILEGFDNLQADRTRAYHLELESSRLAYADRGKYLADPGFVDVPLRGLLSDSFAAERRALLNPTKANNMTVDPGDPSGNQDAHAMATTTGDGAEGRSTTHLTVADNRGTIVTYTFTIESTGGAGIVVPGYGFLLNNELTDFDFSFDRTKLPPANAPDGGKRPRSSMAPTIVTNGRKPLLALGSPGGATIITTVLQILLERIDLGASLPDAVAAPRASQRNQPTSEAESGFASLGEQLTARFGQAFRPVSPASVPADEIGAATAIEFNRHSLVAAAEPSRRGGGAAMVVRPSR